MSTRIWVLGYTYMSAHIWVHMYECPSEHIYIGVHIYEFALQINNMIQIYHEYKLCKTFYYVSTGTVINIFFITSQNVKQLMHYIESFQ